jgi:hypothetical protein
VPIVRNAPPTPQHTAQAAVFVRGEVGEDLVEQIRAKLAPVSIHDQDDSGWRISSNDGRTLVSKLLSNKTALGNFVKGKMYRGVLTGFNDAFIISDDLRQQLIEADPKSADIIKPIVNGEDVRSWFVEKEDRWLIFTRRGININHYPAIKSHLLEHQKDLEPRPPTWDSSKPWPGRKAGAYKWYEIQDSVDYYKEFENINILWPELANRPRFALTEPGMVPNKTAFLLSGNSGFLLGCLMSRVLWFAVMNIAAPFGERRGIQRYLMSAQYISRLPIPDASPEERQAIGDLAMRITAEAKARYELHRNARAQILGELGATGKDLNRKLGAWWDLELAGFREEVRKAFKRELGPRELERWEGWLAAMRARHEGHTAAIVAGETELNERVYRLFELTPDEIRLIEESTKYKYGEV